MFIFLYLAPLLFYYNCGLSLSTESPPSVPKFMITPGNIVVNESVGEVKVCVTSDIPVSTETLVVGGTGPKDGAVTQATGK